MYKIIAWVLSESLKKVLPHIITEYQSTFVGGRQILDATLLQMILWMGGKGEWKKRQFLS